MYTITMSDQVELNSLPNNKPEPLEAMPKGLRILFLVYLQSLNKQVKEQYAQQILDFKKSEFETPEIKMHDFIGHILVGMALSKIDRSIPSLDLQTEPSIDYEEEIASFGAIINAANPRIMAIFHNNDEDDFRLGNQTKEAIFEEFSTSDSKLRFVRELIDVMDGEDWYHLGLFIYELTTVYKDLEKKERINTPSSIKTTSMFRDKFIKPHIDLRKDYDVVQSELLKTMFEQYYPIMRASKVYKFMRHMILLEWFKDAISTLDNPEGITPKLDKPTIIKLKQLHDEYRYQFEDFITIPDSEETLAEMTKYREISTYINTIMQKLLGKYLQEADIAEAMQEELTDTLEDEVESLSEAQIIAKQLMEVFNSMK
jgi:hypothetical protein